MSIKASIIILDYLKADRVTENVKSILNQNVNFSFEIIVVDNSVNEENAKKLSKLQSYDNVEVIINQKNLGYTGGNNQGVERSHGKYLLIVNPDIHWKEKDSLQKLVDYMEANPEVGITGPKQISEQSGQVEMTVRAFPRLFLQIARRTKLRRIPVLRKWVAHDEMQHLDYSKTQPVDWIQSSFWITRRSLWEKLGGLDPSYFIFMADPDLCLKSWKSGLKVMYYPEVTVYADGKRASTGGVRAFIQKKIVRQHFKDAVKYQQNHLLSKNPRKH